LSGLPVLPQNLEVVLAALGPLEILRIAVEDLEDSRKLVLGDRTEQKPLGLEDGQLST
jgi:hypothetical protein